jgi:hypothetical protein
MTSFYKVSSEVNFKELLLGQLLGALGTRPAAALLVTPQIGLYIAPHTPNPRSTDPDDFDPPVFTGYAVQAPTFSTAHNLGAYGQGISATVNFEVTTTGSAAPIAGWFLSDGFGGSPTVVYAEGDLTDEGITLQYDGDVLSLTVVLPLRALQDK